MSPMRARARDEEHRAATPLELFFDLCFVVAVSQAGGRLVHAVTTGHPVHGITQYVIVFFAIWWAWMNFTWFASAYDCDDVPYRVATLVQIAGVLVLAAGIPRAFEHADYSLAVAGYLIMRLVLTLQWLRAAHGERGPARRTAVRYAAGLVVVQLGWVGLLLLPADVWLWGFGPLAVVELAVPAFAERAHRTPWHPHHISERYGLFTIIVLGESIAAATVAVQSALAESAVLGELLPIAAGGLVIVFAAFWIYFAAPIHEYLAEGSQPFWWGYGHYVIFGSAAAIGAGIEVAVEQVTHHTDLTPPAASFAVTAPTALYMVTVWWVHSRHFKRSTPQQLVLPCGAVLVLAATLARHWAVPLAGLVAACTVAVGVHLEARMAGDADRR
nr:low temperature requirement protein A [Streptomyces sp. ODS25]